MKRDYADTTVIIPTLNENNTIAKLIGLLESSYSGISVIVADDGSNDGTKATVQRLSIKNKNIKFFDRSKREHGLTASVLDAAMRVKTKKIIVMDGDMQHPPEKIKQIADKLDEYDLVIGVRTYIKNWGLFRKVISKTMSYLAYIVFKIKGRKTCSDIMSGFFGVRAGLFKRLVSKNKRNFVMRGYKVLLDTLRMLDSDTTIGEVYYSTFHERRFGKSKFNFVQVINTLKSTFM